MTQDVGADRPAAAARDRRRGGREPPRDAREVSRPRRRLPDRRRALVRRARLAVPRHRRGHERFGLRPRAADARARSCGSASARDSSSSRRCCSSTAAFASLPYLFVGGEQLDHPLDAYLEGMSAATTTGASVVTDFDELSKSLVDVAPVHPVARRDGDHHPRRRDPAAAARRRPSDDGVGAPRPRGRRLSERIRETARLLWGLYIALTVVLDARSRVARAGSGSTTR